ncbi:thymidine kinase [Alginatibacterium sediminis]|uniref:Thymidine kinase n=1 Tax=Alginatibacterium sediminis TaxID=2164068 RepID=A0A420EG71_9ALTE|nr:thymidine kinase [Alginatibacterium sediminis]RKF19663.1 thymidine kinase [Alginatibacterium sediminis]
MASLYFKYAAMNSGKSTQLIQAHFNYLERGLKPIAYIPLIDNRAGKGKIKARIGLELEAYSFSASEDLYEHIKQQAINTQVDVVIVDEGQFLNREQVYQLAKIVDELGLPVMVYGLKTDFQANLFEGAYHLLCLADKVEELKTICWCGNKAHFNARVNDLGQVLREGEQIEIGGNERYIALCRKHFMSGQAS